MSGTHGRLPVPNRRKVGMTSSHHGPYVLGCTHATMLATKGSNSARRSESQKSKLSSDRGLQLAPLKSKPLVTADHHPPGKSVPGLVHTARHTTKVGNTRSRWPNPCGGSRRRWGWRLGRSRNKVAVPEGAAGSPPF